MTTSEIIARYNLQVDDSSELSTDEEIALVNEVYIEVANDRPWEWLKAEYSGTTSGAVSYIDLPADFKELSLNSDNEAIVFVGNEYSKYRVVPFSSRRDYRDQSGVCYIDMANKRLVFTLQPDAGKPVEYDYIKIPATLDSNDTPLVETDQFGKLIAYGMAAKFNNIELSEKGSSYQKENQTEYYRILSDERLTDANLKVQL